VNRLSNSREPRPGQAKIRSMMTLPETRVGSSRPARVRNGMAAAARAWRHSRRPSSRPRERAARMKSAASVSSRFAREKRAKKARLP
jgi:hypothetical protein